MIPDDANTGKDLCLRTGDALLGPRYWSHKSDIIQMLEWWSQSNRTVLKIELYCSDKQAKKEWKIRESECRIYY